MLIDTNRNYGLDLLRSMAIIFVFLSHYNLLTNQSLFGLLGQMGGVGVDLFFALSGYLIGNQIFCALKNNTFSMPVFYKRRLLRILPNYLVVLSLYFFIPFVREKPLITPLWQFLTFTQNFNVVPGAFSHAWSLCIEEHFYLLLPIIILFFARKKSVYFIGFSIVAILIFEMAIRSLMWFMYILPAQENIGLIAAQVIYSPTVTRLDSLVLGVFLALAKNYHVRLWEMLTKRGNVFFVFGILAYGIVLFVDQTMLFWKFFPSVLNYSLLSFGSAAFVLSTLSKQSFLYNIKIPGATILATLSYAIYLTHKSLIHMTQLFLAQWELSHVNWIFFPLSVLLSLIGGGVLYLCVERPFLELRDRPVWWITGAHSAP